MPALNRIQLIGYLGRDPEAHFTPSGKRVTHFSLGVTQRWKTGEENRESTEWVNVETWDRLAEISQEYLKKGSLVYVEGRLKTDKYEDNGENRYFTKVVALQMQFLDRRQAEDGIPTPEDTSPEFEPSH
ncbi:MAG TPA: single-stranded DNA-binding protein [Anaerolineales bacterium]|nr:single-stranded DNA-binding protein [Anaerolineales bacterium]